MTTAMDRAEVDRTGLGGFQGRQRKLAELRREVQKAAAKLDEAMAELQKFSCTLSDEEMCYGQPGRS